MGESTSTSPWSEPVPPGTAVRPKVLRFPKRDHPRVVVALANWTPVGFKWLHLTRPVAFHSRDGEPQWLLRAVQAVRTAIDGAKTPRELSDVATAAHRGRGIRSVK